MSKDRVTRRNFLSGLAVGAGGAVLAACAPKVVKETVVVEKPVEVVVKETVMVGGTPEVVEKVVTATPVPTEVIELTHWCHYGNAARWFELVIDPVNEVVKEQGIHINTVDMQNAEHGTKIRAAAAAGEEACDLFWAEAGGQLRPIMDGLLAPLDDALAGAGLNWADFIPGRLDEARFKGKIWLMPTDHSTFGVLLNGAQVEEAGLDVSNPPQTGEEFLEWADKLTVREGDKITRAGFNLTGSGDGILPDWSIIAHQLGAKMWNEDFTKANVTSQACVEAAQFLLDCFDKYKISTRDTAERYKTFAEGAASMFWTGSWMLGTFNTLPELKLTAAVLPLIGPNRWTIGYTSGLAIIKVPGRPKDPAKLRALAVAMNEISERAVEWNKAGELGETCRRSLQEAPDYQNGSVPWEQRRVFVEEAAYSTLAEPLVLDGETAMDYYYGDVLTKHLDRVWMKDISIEEGLENLQKEMQDLADLSAQQIAECPSPSDWGY